MNQYGVETLLIDDPEDLAEATKQTTFGMAVRRILAERDDDGIVSGFDNRI